MEKDLRHTIKKIAVIGPESTGKSTLSEGLALELHTVWVPEYAREYINNLNRPYNEADLLEIAQGQLANEERATANANKFLICDTDLNVIKVWSEHKYNRCHSYILEQIATRHYDLYLLTYIDIDWEPDPQREHADPAMRSYFYQVYRDLVQQSGLPWVEIRGAYEARLKTALGAISNL